MKSVVASVSVVAAAVVVVVVVVVVDVGFFFRCAAGFAELSDTILRPSRNTNDKNTNILIVPSDTRNG